MADVRIKLNRAAVAALLKSVEVQAELTRAAERIAAAAGEGMVAETRVGRTRARASIVTATSAARRAEAHGRRLSAALGAGRQ